MRTGAFIMAALLLAVALAACGQRAGDAPRAAVTATSIPVSAFTAVHALRTNPWARRRLSTIT